jgi:acyl-CoA dehydrogenase
MDFSLTEEEALFQRTVHDFLRANLAPIAREIDSSRHIPESLLHKMGELGLLGATIPEKYGGPGGNITMATIGAMEVGAADPSMATAVYYLLVTGWSHLASKLGTEELKQSLLPGVAKGREFLGIATTEPGGGSDLVAMKTSARREGGKLMLNGEKIFISGVTEAKRTGGGHLTLMKTDPKLKHNGLTFAYVPINSPGIETSVLENMGRMGISTGIISYRDVEIPEMNIIGEYNKGFFHAMMGFNYARTLVSAACVGAAEWALEVGAEYIKKRTAFGSPLAKYEGISFEYADLAVQKEMVKNQVMKAATLLDSYDRGGDVPMRDINIAVSSAKLTAPPLALDTVRKVMTWHGALSYTKDTYLEMAMRGILSYVVGAEGALNIMKLVIVRELLGPDYLPYK